MPGTTGWYDRADPPGVGSAAACTVRATTVDVRPARCAATIASSTPEARALVRRRQSFGVKPFTLPRTEPMLIQSTSVVQAYSFGYFANTAR